MFKEFLNELTCPRMWVELGIITTFGAMLFIIFWAWKMELVL